MKAPHVFEDMLQTAVSQNPTGAIAEYWLRTQAASRAPEVHKITTMATSSMPLLALRGREPKPFWSDHGPGEHGEWLRENWLRDRQE